MLGLKNDQYKNIIVVLGAGISCGIPSLSFFLNLSLWNSGLSFCERSLSESKQVSCPLPERPVLHFQYQRLQQAQHAVLDPCSRDVLLG